MNSEKPVSERESGVLRGWGKWLAIGGLAAAASLGGAVAFSGERSYGSDIGRMLMMDGQGGSGAAQASMREAGFRGHHRGFYRMLEELELTEEQEEKIWDIVDQARSEVRPVMREFRKTRREAAELLAAENIDRAAVEKLRSERIASLDEVSKKMVDAMLQVAEVLSPEQRAEVLELIEEHRWHRR